MDTDIRLAGMVGTANRQQKYSLWRMVMLEIIFLGIMSVSKHKHKYV